MEKMKPVIGNILENYPSSPVASLDHESIPAGTKRYVDGYRIHATGGKAVEINALWIGALMEAEAMGILTAVSPDSAREEFKRFWNETAQCLYDVIDPVDPAIRRNQVIAISLGLVNPEQATTALDTINRLSPDAVWTSYAFALNPKYQGYYTGDSSYHNGSVWPWLTGCYVEALLRNDIPRERAAWVLAPVLQHIREAGMGYISKYLMATPPTVREGA